VPEAAWRLRKARSLVKLLVLAPGHRLHREQVLDLLWPDQEPGAAISNFRQTLYVARRALEPGGSSSSRYLAVRGEILVLCPTEPLWTDMEAFAIAVARARRSREPADYRAALDLYAGDLLPEDRFEEWASDHREGLRREYLAVLVELAEVLEGRGEYPPAMEALRRALATDPASEGAHRGLMRLYARTDRRQEALRQFQTLEEVLRREVGVEPDPASRRSYEDILDGRFPPPDKGPVDAPAGTPAREEAASEPPRTNLPARLSSFVGREREIAQIGRMLAKARLLTLTGTGGCGKTALALAAAADLLGAFPDGVWLAGLAALEDPALVPQAVAQALGLREEPGRPLDTALADHLHARRVLLVLDNCEHLAEACATLADRLLRACPELRILATSREPLRSEGEMTWVVPSLSLPDPRREASPESLAESEAVRLFADRAGAVLPGWGLGSENAEAVVRVCRRLDGIPLAIELAAARVNVLAVAEIAARLEEDFVLLAGGNRTALPRHQSLRATLDWSYGLLTEAAQAWFRQLGVFAGSFTLEAAAAVCASGERGAGSAEQSESGLALDLLSELVNKSMVVAEPSGRGTVRYRLLEPLRQYARGLLVERGEAPAIRRRHAAHYAALAEGIEPYLMEPAGSGLDQRTWFDRLEAEHDNLRAALRSALEGEDPETALRLSGAIAFFWFGRGHYSEGLRGLEEPLVRDTGAPAELRAKAAYGAALLRLGAGDPERGERWAREGLALYRQHGDTRRVAMGLHMLCMIVGSRGDFEGAKVLISESVALSRALGDRRNVGASLASLGIAKQALGDPEGASDLEEGLALLREVGDHTAVGTALENAGYLACLQGDFARAAALGTRGLAQFREMGENRGAAAGCMELTAITAQVQGRAERAARLFGAAEALRKAAGSAMFNAWQGEYERHVAAVRAALGEEAFATAWAMGRQMSAERAMEYAATP
jgi:predicted ATPase/DNA-binding SARP family transcriptional activator